MFQLSKICCMSVVGKAMYGYAAKHDPRCCKILLCLHKGIESKHLLFSKAVILEVSELNNAERTEGVYLGEDQNRIT